MSKTRGWLWPHERSRQMSCCRQANWVLNKLVQPQLGELPWENLPLSVVWDFTVDYCNNAPKSLRFWLPLILLQSSKPTSMPVVAAMILFQTLVAMKICLLHSLAMLVSSQPTSCFAHELPFSVANAGRQTTFSIEAHYISTGWTPSKKFPLSVVRIHYALKVLAGFN